MIRSVLASILLAALAAPAGLLGAEAPSVPVEEIIRQFVQKETDFTKAREAYTYRQSVKVTDYGYNEGRPIGQWELVQDIVFGPNRERTERVVYAPVSTLQSFSLSPQDMEDLRSVQPFVMTNETRHLYDIDYIGEEKIDEIECYVFSVKPKTMEKGERYFQGQVWVDKLDLQIVKTYGRGVGLLKKNEDQQFPLFETYRNIVDDQFWFPVYTRADDTLHFKTGDVKMKMVIKYEDYKRFGSEADITFGDIVDDTGGQTGETPDQDPQIEQPQ